MAARRAELLGDQHGKGCANRTTDQPELNAGALSAVKLCVVAGPGGISLARPFDDQSAHQVGVGVENADRRYNSRRAFWRRASRRRPSGLKTEGEAWCLSNRIGDIVHRLSDMS
jgi:hypothetical protein